MSVKCLTLFALALCLLASCKKNNNNAKPNPNRLKIFIETDSMNGTPIPPDTFYLTYDNDNRLTSVTNKTEKVVYTYQGKTATLDAYQYNQFSEHAIYYLNSAYNIDSTFDYGNRPDTSSEGYRYTGGLLTTRLEYNYSSYGNSLPLRYDFTYDNAGNMIKQVESDEYGNVICVTTATYTSYPVNAILSPAFVPQQAKYLEAAETQVTGSGGHLPSFTCAYSFDSLSRLIRQTKTFDVGYVGVTTYVYE